MSMDRTTETTARNTTRRSFVAGMGAVGAAMLSACNQQQETAEETTTDTDTETVDEEYGLKRGYTLAYDKDSPTGYTVTFVYDGSTSEKPIESVSVTGPFRLIDPKLDLFDENNQFTPEEYENGMYPSNYIPAAGFEDGWGYTVEMADTDGDGIYVVSFPLASGPYAYSYVISYKGEEEPVTIDDPAWPSPAKDNPDSITETGDLTHSVVCGTYDPEKQSASNDLDYVERQPDPVGSMSYVSYEGSDGETQYLGIYLPTGYDADRDEPYKTIYASHGGGGNETDWFAMGRANHIMDAALADESAEEALIVTMDNSHYEWDFAKIEENVLEFIIPFVEANYNVSTEAADRAFCGLSMGAMTTMNMYFDHPSEFGAFGIWSGTDMTAVKDTEGLDQPTVMVAVGTCDIASEKIMPNDDEERKKKYEDMVAWVEEQDLPNIDCYGYVQGSHDWFTWSQCFHIFITEYLWK